MIEEKGRALPELRLPDVERIEEAVRVFRRAATTAMLDLAGVKTPSDRYVAIKESAPEEVMPQTVYAFCKTRQGARLAISLALQGAGMDKASADAEADTYQIDDAGNLAAALLGFERRTPPDAGTQGGAPPLAGGPGTSATS